MKISPLGYRKTLKHVFFVIVLSLPCSALADQAAVNAEILAELERLKERVRILETERDEALQAAETSARAANAAENDVVNQLDPETLEKLIQQLAEQKKAEELEAAKVAQTKPREERTDEDVSQMSRGKLLEEGLLPGYTTFPGTNTQFRLSGFVRVDTIHDFNKTNIDNDPGNYAQGIIVEGEDGHGERGNTFINPSTTRLNLDMQTPTPGHGQFENLDVFFEGDFYPDSSKFRIRQAYGEWGPLLIGQTWPMWMDLKATAPSFDFAGPVTSTVIRTPEIRWDQKVSETSKFGVALDTPDGEIFRPTVDGETVADVDNSIPDLTLRWLYTPDWGHLQLAGMARSLRTQGGEESYYNDNTLGWGAAFSGKFDGFGEDKMGFSLTYGKGMGRWRTAANGLNADAVLTENGLETVESYGGFLTYTHVWTPKLTSSLVYSYMKSDNPVGSPDSAMRKNNYFLANILWHANPLINVIAEFSYVDRTNITGAFGDSYRINIGFVYKFHKDVPSTNAYRNLSYLFGGG